MKWLIPLLVLYGVTCYATVSVPHSGQHVCGTSTTCNENAAFTSNAGDTIIIQCGTVSARTINTPTDSGGNSYTALSGPTIFGGSKEKWFISTNIIGFTSGHVNCNVDSSTTIAILFGEFSGLSGTVDVTATDKTYSSTTPPWASNTLTTTDPNDLIVTAVDEDAHSGLYTVPAGFTAVFLSNGVSQAMAYKVVSSTQNTTYSWGGNQPADNSWVAVTSLHLGVATSTHRPLVF